MRRDDKGSGLACRAALLPRGGKGGEEREDGRDSGTETRGSRRGRAVHGTGRRRAAENGRGRREKRNIGAFERRRDAERGNRFSCFLGFIIYHLISRHLAGCHWNALDLFHRSTFIQHFVKNGSCHDVQGRLKRFYSEVFQDGRPRV